MNGQMSEDFNGWLSYQDFHEIANDEYLLFSSHLFFQLLGVGRVADHVGFICI